MSLARKGISLAEALVCLGIFAVLALVGFVALQRVTMIWQRSSARDLAQRQLLRAARTLRADLANSSRRAGQWATATVGPNLGQGLDGDALTFLTGSSWNLDADGQARMDRWVTYYLVVPNNGDACSGGVDGEGYEQQCPHKWLVRLEEAAPAAVTPSTEGQITNSWTGALASPTTLWEENERRVVAINLLQFRIREKAPNWDLELTAVALDDARRQLRLGTTPLAGTRFALTHRLYVRARN